jgi:phytoene dehydrogenase-like protein
MSVISLGADIPALYEFLTAPSSSILNHWFESEPLKGTLLTDAVIGMMTEPDTPGSG